MDNASRPGNATNARRRTVNSRRTTIKLSPEAQEIVERFKSASGTSTSAAIEDVKRAEDEMDLEYVEKLLPGKKKPAPKENRAGRRK
jgi:hypothetical protein